VDRKGPDPGSDPEPPKGPEGDAQRFARDRLEVMQTYASLGSVGLSFVFAVVLGTGLGLWLDRLTGWSPAFTLIFFVVGLVAGVLNVYRAVSRLK
jgi:predicted F0F1-ATPase subunit